MSQLIAESSASWLVRSSPTPLPNFRIAGKPIGIYPPKRWAHCRRSTMLTPEYSLVNQSRTTAYLPGTPQRSAPRRLRGGSVRSSSCAAP